jgi:hypothetical protein
MIKKFNRLDFLIRAEVHTKHLLPCVWSIVIITSAGISLNVSSGNEIFCCTCPHPKIKKKSLSTISKLQHNH